MAGIDLSIAKELRHLVYYFLDNNLLSNAVFLATRLLAHEPSPDATHLVSLCYLRLDQLSTAAEYSESFGKTGQHPGCTYVFAQCCLGLGRFKHGIQALEQSRNLATENQGWGKHSQSNRRTFPDAAAVHCLLGKLYHGYDDVQAAVESYTEALKLNPFMWDAFTHLCDLGVAIKIPNIFKATSTILASASQPFSSESPSPSVPGRASHVIADEYGANQNRSKTSWNADPFSTSTRHNLQCNSGDPKVILQPSKIPHALFPSATTNGGVANDTKISTTTDNPSIPQDPATRISKDDRGGTSAYSIFRSSRASTRKHETTGLESIDAPSRMRASFTKRSRITRHMEGDKASDSHAQSSASQALVVDRKRLPSGQLVHSQSRDISAGSIGTRRSDRLKSQLRPSNISNLNNASTREEREFKIPKGLSRKRLGTSAISTAMQVDRSRADAEDAGFCSESVNLKPLTKTALQGEIIFPPTERYEGLCSLLDLFKQLGRGYYLLNHFKCQEALSVFDSIPAAQRETAWVLARMARCHFELARYTEAVRLFSKVRVMSSLRTDDMDIYSTCLWHLKREVDLAFLSYELVELDRLSPQTWCAVGNSFSLQRDHANAVKCFRRATQLDSKFAYAFTLEGHEHIFNEEYGKAMQAFRNGVAANKRHYNAWYGLGIVYQKLGKFDLAVNHFRIASKINPINAMLTGCIGVALESKKELKMALQYYTRACEISPDSVFARERKADVLLQLKDLQGASAELAILKDLTPQRAYVYVLLGRMYGLANNKGKAMHNFTIALSLDPQAGYSIKSDIESLEDEDVM